MKRKSRRKIWITLLACLCLLSAHAMCTFAAEDDVIQNNASGIPDKGLYRAIQDKLGKKRNQTFTEKEAQSITVLEIGYRYKIGIKTLKGIEHLSNLKTLDVSGYQLKSLKGIEKLPKLTSLVAEGNKLTNLKSISKAKNLVSLCLERNRLKSLSGIESLKKLKYICVRENKLTSLKGIKNLKNLRRLEADNNKLTSLKGLEKLKQLNDLQVSGNQIKSLKAIQKLKKIKYLNVSNNKLTSLSGLTCTKTLKNLDASYNQITRLPDMKKNKELSILGCKLQFNRLSEEEIRSKLPEKLFRKGQERERWLERQLYFQNIMDTMEFIMPADGIVKKDTTKIVGKIHREADVRLANVTKGIVLESVQADENGVFTMDHLDLQSWAGDQITFYMSDDFEGVVNLPVLTVQG